MINIQNIADNQCFKWCLVRYLNLADHHPVRITKSDKDFAKKLDFKDIKYPVKVRDIHTLYCRRKHFYCYCLQAFSTENVILKTSLKVMATKGF